MDAAESAVGILDGWMDEGQELEDLDQQSISYTCPL